MNPTNKPKYSNCISNYGLGTHVDDLGSSYSNALMPLGLYEVSLELSEQFRNSGCIRDIDSGI